MSQFRSREIDRQRSNQLSRRALIRSASALGLSAPVLATAGASATGQVSAASALAAQEPVQGGELRFGTTTEGVSMHPFKVTDVPSFDYIDKMFSLPLLRYGLDTLELEPFAAASVAENAERTELTFTLRDDLLWSDGTPLTATDYAWTWAQAATEANAWPRLGTYSPYIASVTDANATTLVVTLKTPLAINREKAINALGYVLPRHIWESLDWNDNPEVMAPTVVAGPYLLQEWVKDQYATFVANDRFLLGRPHIDTITMRIFGNANVATQAVLNGEIDQYGPEPENWPQILENQSVTAYQWDAPNAAVTYFGLNCRQPALQDKRVRQALNFALDKELITEQLTYGLGKRASTMYLPSSWVYNPEVEPYTYNPDMARQILDEAGWTEGADGIRQKDGQPLSLLFIYGPNTTPIREQMATVAQQQWRDVGADVEVQGLEWGAYLQMTKEGPYDWSSFVNAYIASVDPDLIWFKREADPSYNRVDFQNARVQELYEQGLVEFDRERRAAIYQEIQQILTDESPWIWLYYEQGKSAISTRVQGIRITKMGLNDVWEWWIQE